MFQSRKSAVGDASGLQLARALGWLSIGLGAIEILAPGTLARVLETPRQRKLFRIFGFREVANGLAVLLSSRPTPWIWGRVAGDVLDIAALAAGGRSVRRPPAVGIALLALAGMTALDVFCACKLSTARKPISTLRHRYHARSGFRSSAETARGSAASVEVPGDLKIPSALRPWAI
jgi:hypothetical protein